MTTRRQFLGWGMAAAGAVAFPSIAACGSSSKAPSPSGLGSVGDAEAAATLALTTAQQGAGAGSYGIGGALIHAPTGQVLQTMPNRVFRTLDKAAQQVPGETFVVDPTAHGERQLMSWYLANRAALSLPAPEELTVVTSLDPCLMCTGSLLTGGVNVGVVADDDYSGINYNQSGSFADLPEPLRGQAREAFGYYAVQGGRAYQGGERTAFRDTAISQATLAQSASLYAQSADVVRTARSGDNTSPAKLQNPGERGVAVNVVRAYRVTYDRAFDVRIPDGRRPTGVVRQALEDLVAASPGSTNAVALLDPFGNLVTAAADQEVVNPLSTAFALCTRQYAQTRYALVNDPWLAPEARATLTNPTFGTFVFLRAPDPRTSVGMFDIGAYGSTMGSQPTPYIPSALQYYNLPTGVTERELQDLMVPLPPLYSAGIKIMPQRVVS